MKILALSDVEYSFIYNPVAALRFQDVDMVIGCGDLSYIYIEHLANLLGVPTYFVRGNHEKPLERKLGVRRKAPWGARDLHRKCVRDDHSGLLLAGIEGSIRYNKGMYQYTQGEMFGMVLGLVPRLLVNRIRYGRYLDVFVSHASPWEIHAGQDRAHLGIRAFRWLIRVFQPAVHLHGHIHVYSPLVKRVTWLKKTCVVNVYGYRELEIDMGAANGRPFLRT